MRTKLRRGKSRGPSSAPKAPTGRPLPEMIDGEQWDVKPGLPEVDLAKRLMTVPFGADEYATYLQAHEMCHVAFTPPNLCQIVSRALVERYGKLVFSQRSIQTLTNAVEDARMAAILNGLDMPVPKVKAIPPATLATLKTQPLENQLATLAATYNTPDFLDVEKAIGMTTADRSNVRDVLSSLHRDRYEMYRGDEGYTLSDTYPAYLAVETTLELFDILQTASTVEKADEMLSEDGKPLGDPSRDPRDGSASSSELLEALKEAMREDFTPSEQELADITRYIRERKPGEYAVTPAIKYKVGRHTVQWNEMTVTTRPLSERLPVRIRHPRNISSDVGAVPYAMHRLTSDQRVFRQRRRMPGGSVLIDTSGSMCLSNDDLNQLLEAMPAAVIATYSGEDRGQYGELWIIAKDGRRVSRRAELAPNGNGNGCDYPALLWLAEQESPRFWICDGLVTTGFGTTCLDCTLPRLQCELLCYHARILRLESTEALTGRFR